MSEYSNFIISFATRRRQHNKTQLQVISVNVFQIQYRFSIPEAAPVLCNFRSEPEFWTRSRKKFVLDRVRYVGEKHGRENDWNLYGNLSYKLLETDIRTRNWKLLNPGKDTEPELEDKYGSLRTLIENL